MVNCENNNSLYISYEILYIFKYKTSEIICYILISLFQSKTYLHTEHVLLFQTVLCSD